MNDDFETTLRADLRTLGEAIAPAPRPFAPPRRRTSWRPIAIGSTAIALVVAGGTAAAVSLLPDDVRDTFETFSSVECGGVDFAQALQVASLDRRDGNQVQLWVAPAERGAVVANLRTVLPDGSFTGAVAICGPRDPNDWTFGDASHTVGETTFEHVVAGHTSLSATSIRLEYDSGAVAIADVGPDGYFITTFDGGTGSADGDPTITVLSP